MCIIIYSLQELTRSVIPNLVTIALAIPVAVLRSLEAPLVMFSAPNTISSATLPPIATSIRARSCRLLHDSSSVSGSIETWGEGRGERGEGGEGGGGREGGREGGGEGGRERVEVKKTQ